MLFIVEQIDSNATTFNKNTSYHVIFEYSPIGNHLRKFSSEIHRKMYHGFEIEWSKLEDDLEEALKFQRAFVEVVCACLDVIFINNDIISCFEILNPTNMPSGDIGLQNWGLIELEKILAHYGHDRSQEGSKFLAFKLQATTEWTDKTCGDL